MQLRKLAKDMHAEKGFYVHPAVVVSKLKKAKGLRPVASLAPLE